MMPQADISVLITNYNHSEFLFECLEAVFAQSVSPREIIVIDDASTDNSIELIREYQKKRSFILLENPVNLGPAKNMNVAIRHAKGKYIVLAAADDKILPGFFEEAARCLDQHPELGICCSNPSFFRTDDPNSLMKVLIRPEKAVKPLPAQNIVKDYLHSSLWIPTHSSLYRRDLVLKYGCLDENLKHICDWYLNCKIAIQHGIIFVPNSYGAFRLSPQSYGATWNRSYQKKIQVYHHLFRLIAQEPLSFQKRFVQSGALGLITADVLLYLLLRPSLWKYIPHAFYRKTRNFLRKFRSTSRMKSS